VRDTPCRIKRRIIDCILQSDVNPFLILSDWIGGKVGRALFTLSARFKAKALTMPRANDFTEVVNSPLTKGFTIVGTLIFDCKQRMILSHDTNSFAPDDEQSRLTRAHRRVHFSLRREDFDPIH
jgi:hypothetical protein